MTRQEEKDALLKRLQEIEEQEQEEKELIKAISLASQKIIDYKEEIRKQEENLKKLEKRLDAITNKKEEVEEVKDFRVYCEENNITRETFEAYARHESELMGHKDEKFYLGSFQYNYDSEEKVKNVVVWVLGDTTGTIEHFYKVVFEYYNSHKNYRFLDCVSVSPEDYKEEKCNAYLF